MSANATPENVESVPSVTVDIDRTMLDAVEGEVYTPAFPDGYREYLENHIPEDTTAEFQYMYLFGDLHWSMDGASRVGTSDLSHADIIDPASEEAAKSFEEAVREYLDPNSGDVIALRDGVIPSANEGNNKSEDKTEQ